MMLPVKMEMDKINLCKEQSSMSLYGMKGADWYEI